MKRSSVSPSKTGVLLINLGTPSRADHTAVRRYLREFLSDRRVIELPPLLWRPILYGMVLPFRPFRSAQAYQRIWDRIHDASPLSVFTRSQAELLQERLPSDVKVAWGMRYGKPSVASALQELMTSGCERLVVLPLYPQYCAATTATANDALFRELMRLRVQPAIHTVPPFPRHEAYISALAQNARVALAELPFVPQKVILSFHGMPRRAIERGDRYAEHVEQTAHALRAALGFTAEAMPLTYQSRFGRAAWLEPYTAPFVHQCAKDDIKRIAVITPGFLSDCLETLDEIGNELRDEFFHAGGESFAHLPCLNDRKEAIDLLENLVRPGLDAFN